MGRLLRGGFTLAELLVVITVLGVLLGLLIPAVSAVRDHAKRTLCSNRQHELGLALVQYELSKGHFPGHGETVGQVNVNWAIRTLPYLGRQDLWSQWTTAGQTGRRTSSQCADVALFRCPSDTPTEAYPLTYVVNCGLPNWGPFPREDSGGNDWPANGVFHLCNTRIEPPWGTVSLSARNWRNSVYVSRSDIKDGLRQTILLSENLQATEWVRNVGGTPYANIDEYRIGDGGDGKMQMQQG